MASLISILVASQIILRYRMVIYSKYHSEDDFIAANNKTGRAITDLKLIEVCSSPGIRV